MIGARTTALRAVAFLGLAVTLPEEPGARRMHDGSIGVYGDVAGTVRDVTSTDRALFAASRNVDSAVDTPRSRQVTFKPLASFPGSLDFRDPWSPTSSVVAFDAPDGLYVFDAAATPAAPMRLRNVGASTLSWSPDGRWLLCRFESGGGLASLVAVPISGAAPSSLVQEADVGNSVWATDGSIFYWGRQTGIRYSLDPPSEWRAANPHPLPERTSLVTFVDPATGHPRTLQSSGSKQADLFILGPDAKPDPDIEMVIPKGVLPDGRGFLVDVTGRHMGSLIVDRAGAILVNLTEISGMGFIAGSVSPDGRLVIGSVAADEFTYRLHVMEANGAWQADVTNAPLGSYPHFAHVPGMLVAYDADGTIHVGSLEIR